MLVVSLACLVRSHSASSLASLLVVLAAVAGIYALSRLSLRLRGGVTIAVAVVLPLTIAIGAGLGLQDLILASFGKDATLTGRTYLWAEGFKFGMQHPGFGVGYAAFWVPGRPQAERYWYEFFIGTRSGFHFHDTYVEVFVELGIAGFLVLAGWMMTTLFKSVRAITVHGPTLDLNLSIGIAVLLLIRSFVEVDVLGPFGIGPFLFFPLLPKLAAYKRGRPVTTGAGSPAPAG